MPKRRALTTVPKPPLRTGFTLVELLVVIAIIVVLLAVLVPSLSKAMEYADNTKCVSNQSNIVKSMTMYSKNYKDIYPVPQIGRSSEAQDVPYAPSNEFKTIERTRRDLTQGQAQQDTAGMQGRAPLGLGLLVGEYLPQSNLGEIIHCPRLDTSSATAVDGRQVIQRYGMDEIGSNNQTAGGSEWDNISGNNYRIAGSFNYRALSWFRSNNQAVLTYNHARSTFVMLTDLIDPQYGRNSHHLDGYNIALGDGSTTFFEDERGVVETIPGNPEYPYPSAKTNRNNNVNSELNGANPWGEEAIYNYMSPIR